MTAKTAYELYQSVAETLLVSHQTKETPLTDEYKIKIFDNMVGFHISIFTDILEYLENHEKIDLEERKLRFEYALAAVDHKIKNVLSTLDLDEAVDLVRGSGLSDKALEALRKSHASEN